MALETLTIYLERLEQRVYLNIPACMIVFNQLGKLTFYGDMKDLDNLLEREIVSLFFLTTEFLNFIIQDNNN